MQPNPYGGADDGGHPVGFGAERANLMNEEEVNMDNANAIQQAEAEKEIVTSAHNYEETKTNVVDDRLRA